MAAGRRTSNKDKKVTEDRVDVEEEKEKMKVEKRGKIHDGGVI